MRNWETSEPSQLQYQAVLLSAAKKNRKVPFEIVDVSKAEFSPGSSTKTFPDARIRNLNSNTTSTQAQHKVTLALYLFQTPACWALVARTLPSGSSDLCRRTAARPVSPSHPPRRAGRRTARRRTLCSPCCTCHAECKCLQSKQKVQK